MVYLLDKGVMHTFGKKTPAEIWFPQKTHWIKKIRIAVTSLAARLHRLSVCKQESVTNQGYVEFNPSRHMSLEYL